MDRLVLKLRSDGSPFASTRNYEKLINKPTINGQELTGDLTTEDLKIVSQKTQSDWASDSSYIPKLGEICIYTDTNAMKIGDGVTAIVQLPYVKAEFNTMRDDDTGLFVSSIDASGNQDPSQHDEGDDTAANDTEYEYIDFYNGTETVRHPLKDATARQDIAALDRRMILNVKDGSGAGATIENCVASEDANEPTNAATGRYAHAEGCGTTASGHIAHAEGADSTASGRAAHAEGGETAASGEHAHSEGNSTVATGGAAHAEGRFTVASGAASHAEGDTVIASGKSSHAQGRGTTANHLSQFVFGEYNEPDGSEASAENRGNYIEVVGNGTGEAAKHNARTLDWNGNERLAGFLVIEDGTPNGAVITGARWNALPYHIRDGAGDHAIVENLVTPVTDDQLGSVVNEASGDYAHAENYANTASGHYAHAEGYHTLASGAGAHAEGCGTKARSAYTHAGGQDTDAAGDVSYVCGVGTIASHKGQFVFGRYNVADPSELGGGMYGTYIEVVGNGQDNILRSNARTLDWNGNERLAGGLTLGAGTSSEASLTPTELGGLKNNMASVLQVIGNVPKNSRDGTGRGAVVIASDAPSRASGENSVAESSGNATGRNSHAEGNGSLAQGNYSHAEGYNTTASGVGSHAEGYSAVANGEYAHVQGYGTIASGQYQHAGGRWNMPDSTSAEIIGNGAANKRSNARTLDWDGNESLAGGLTLGKGTSDETMITAAQLKALLALLN